MKHLSITLLVVTLFQASIVAANEDVAQTREITIEALDFKVTAPSHWKTEINELVRGNVFLRFQEAIKAGRLGPASINFQCFLPNDKPFTQLPDHEVYAANVLSNLPDQIQDAKLLNSEKADVDGYSGAQVDYEALVNKRSVRIRQFTLVHPSGKNMYIITLGTTPKDWERSVDQLMDIYQSVSLIDEQRN